MKKFDLPAIKKLSAPIMKKLSSPVRHFVQNISQEYLIDTKKEYDFPSALITANDPTCYITEQYCSLASALIRSEQLKDSKSFVFTSPQPRDGKSTTIANVGIVLASHFNKQTVVVDADVRRPHVRELLNADVNPGLTELLAGTMSLDEVVKVTEFNNLDFITSGQSQNESGKFVFDVNLFQELIDELSKRYDYVLFDTPPILKVADAGVIGHLVDAVLLVVRAQSTPEKLIESAYNLLISHDAKPTASILVNHRHEVDIYNYVLNPHYRNNYYTSYYRSYGNNQVDV